MTREELLKKAKPILFNPDMVHAIIFNLKNTTRRVIKYKNYTYKHFYPVPSDASYIRFFDGYHRWNSSRGVFDVKPPFKVGDYLYVRETWCNATGSECNPEYYYFADTKIAEDYDSTEWTWSPSIHMPKKAARIFLKITDIEIEHLQDITIDGIRSEGLTSMAVHAGDEEIAYKEWEQLWDSTIKKSDLSELSWKANPWVWVISFERVEVED